MAIDLIQPHDRKTHRLQAFPDQEVTAKRSSYKAENINKLLVGHVTKDGQLAGPRILSTWSIPSSTLKGKRTVRIGSGV